jgi:hypothetical protein
MRVQTPLVIFDGVGRRQDVISSFKLVEDESAVQMLWNGEVYVKKYETQTRSIIWMTVIRNTNFAHIVERLLEAVEGSPVVIFTRVASLPRNGRFFQNPPLGEFIRIMRLPPPSEGQLLRMLPPVPPESISESGEDEYHLAVEASLRAAEEEREATAVSTPMKREWAAVIRERADEAQEGDYECCVCQDKAVSILFHGACSHCAVCDECARLIVEGKFLNKCCPLCRASYENATPVRVIFATKKKLKAV